MFSNEKKNNGSSGSGSRQQQNFVWFGVEGDERKTREEKAGGRKSSKEIRISENLVIL